MTKHFLFVIIIIVLITNCKSTDKTEELDALHRFEKEKGIGGSCYSAAKKEGFTMDPEINIDDTSKEIILTDVMDELIQIDRGIKYHYYKIDYDKKTISFYKKNDSLIITILIIDNKRFKVIDYADWLESRNLNEVKKISDDETRDQILSNIEQNAISYFVGGKYYDKERIYTLTW